MKDKNVPPPSYHNIMYKCSSLAVKAVNKDFMIMGYKIYPLFYISFFIIYVEFFEQFLISKLDKKDK